MEFDFPLFCVKWHRVFMTVLNRERESHAAEIHRKRTTIKIKHFKC